MEQNKHLAVSCTLEDQDNKIRFYAFIDFEAIDYSFVNENFMRCQNLSLYKLIDSRDLNVIDERLNVAEDITHVTKIRLDIESHSEELSLFVTRLDHYSVILEMPWLCHHDARILLVANTL